MLTITKRVQMDENNHVMLDRIIESRVFLYSLSFLSAEDLLQGAITCRSWLESCNNDTIWKAVFIREKMTDESEFHQDEWIKELMRRPLSRDAVGWTVKVESESDGSVHQGIVREVQRNCFLVEYGDGHVVWEYEGRLQGPWHAAGQSRFHWVAGPDPELDEENDQQENNSRSSASPSALVTAVASAPNSCHRPSPRKPVISPEQELFESITERVDRSTEYISWKQEYKSLMTQVPQELVLKLQDNNDEVLDLAFSHSGDYLATCSRDEFITIYKVHSPTEVELLQQSYSRGTPCRVMWRPDDCALLITNEEPQGNAFGNGSEIELWRVDESGYWAQDEVFPCCPFDLHGCWLPDNRFLVGFRLNREADGTGVFHQQLAVYKETLTSTVDGDAKEENLPKISALRYQLSTEIELIFSNTNFAHLFQVSPDPDLPLWGLFSTGTNPFLGHQIKIMPLQSLREINTPKNLSFNVGTLESLECGGAICSVRISSNNKLIFANVRPFMDDSYRQFEGVDFRTAAHMDCPDISNQIVVQVWHAENKTKLLELQGHHAFTTKLCPFLIFCNQSCCNQDLDYISSGSEDKNVYIWHLRYGKLVKVLKGHTDVVSAVSWNTKYPGMLVSASDDWCVCVWGRKPQGWDSV